MVPRRGGGMAVSKSIREADHYQVLVEVLLNEAELALLSISRMLMDGAEADVVRDAVAVYESIRAARKDLAVSAAEASALNAKMDRLRESLRFLGERV